VVDVGGQGVEVSDGLLEDILHEIFRIEVAATQLAGQGRQERVVLAGQRRQATSIAEFIVFDGDRHRCSRKILGPPWPGEPVWEH
jgi:hypothetical protein